SRPFAINQSTGKLLFTSGPGRVSVAHMNPFVYNYRISVAQQELVSTAVTDFLKLLLPPSLAGTLGTQAGEASKTTRLNAPAKLNELERRLGDFTEEECRKNGDALACAATAEMKKDFDKIREHLYKKDREGRYNLSDTFMDLLNSNIKAAGGGGVIGPTESEFRKFSKKVTELRNGEADTYTTCDKAETLNTTLAGYDFDKLFGELKAAEEEMSILASLTGDLEQLTVDYSQDTALKDKIIRCSAFNCTTQFKQYALAVRELIGAAGYELKIKSLRDQGQGMVNMLVLTNQMKHKQGLFARTFEIPRKFELSQATISVKREEVKAENTSGGNTQSGKPAATDGGGIPTGAVLGGASNEGSVGGESNSNSSGQLQSGTAAGSEGSGSGTGSAPAAASQFNEVIQLGRPRFMLSGGMAYSPLPRRTFKAAKGFVLDAQGNPTGNGDKNVIGFDQNSPRRLFPMVFLNSRVLDREKASLFFSIGITAKHDDNLDMEYLIGPSVSFLNDRALFTFGAYGGLAQNLVDDVRIGDEVTADLGDAKFFRKRMTWKPGFSMSYSFSKTTKRAVTPSNTGANSPSDELKNEIRIGGIPFNLALGLAYTSLEQRTYDGIAGFAKNRQGALTNGRTLARIVGLTSSSNYRLTPLAMLHTRLTNLGAHDFYFTSGITGKKTNDDF